MGIVSPTLSIVMILKMAHLAYLVLQNSSCELLKSNDKLL